MRKPWKPSEGVDPLGLLILLAMASVFIALGSGSTLAVVLWFGNAWARDYGVLPLRKRMIAPHA